MLFLAVASYIGVYLYNALSNTYVTTTAVRYAIEDTFPAQGYIVRTETVLTDVGAAILPVVGEGEKVASGQAIAVEYLNRSALEAASEIRELKFRIAQLESPGNNEETAGFESVIALSTAVRHGDLSRLGELSLNVETFIFSGGSMTVGELPYLRARLESLERETAGMRTIHAPASGTFSHVIDGFEHVGPRSLAALTPADLDELFRTPAGTHGVGKLVTEFNWYYAAVMDSQEASRLSVGRQYPVQFYGSYHAEADMTIESVGRREDGMCVVVFSSDRSIHDVAQLRGARADVVIGVVSGIRVPKEAIHLDDDGATFVYLQTGVRAERVDVEILLDAGDGFIVRDGAETGTPLRTDSTIIVKANNLYDGKIVA